VFDEVLDAAACTAMRRFQRRAQRAPHSNAALDLRRTRAVASSAWGTIVKAIRDLRRSGHEVTVVAGARLRGLLELSGVFNHAHVIIVT
jgi:anti-anti-sigma regulatory factor